MKLTLQQKITVACVVLVLGMVIGWATAQIPPPKQDEPEIQTPSNVTVVELSDEACAKLEDLVNGW